MTASQVALAYLVASVLFILALKGLSHPETARRGNLFGIVGMLIAVLTTLALTRSIGLILAGIVVGGAIGAMVARRVQMTQMPELVAAMHSLVGMAAVLIAVAVVNNPPAFNIPEPMPRGNRLELFIGTFVGAITFSGSVIAFGKLAGLGKHFRLFSSAPVVFKGQHLLNLGACRRHGRVRARVLLRRAGRPMAAVHRHDRDRLRPGRADHHPHRRGRHAGGDLHAQLLLRLGRRRASASRSTTTC